MSVMPVMPRDEREWTVADLEHLPDDGLQYELLDGVLLVSPAPVLAHQRMAARFHLLLAAACPPDEPSLVAYDLKAGHYVEAGRARGDQTIRLELPFPVTITPSALVRAR